MRADGDTEGYAIAGFTISLVGLVSISAAPAILLAAITSSDDERQVTSAVIGGVVGLLVLPVLGMVFAASSKGRIRRATQPLRGDGLADAAMVVGILSVVALMAWVAALVATMSTEDDDAGSAPVEAQGQVVANEDGAPVDEGLADVGPAVVDDGYHLVGSDMPAGRWEAIDPAPTCEWVRLANEPQNEDDLNVIEEGTGTTVVVEPTDVSFMSWDCGRWGRTG